VLIAIFSDVHGNLLALERMLSDTKSIVDKYVCLGDTVNYGPWGNECVELVCLLPNITYISGNHERLFNDHTHIKDELPLVQTFSNIALSNFSKYDLIRNLPDTCEVLDYICSHTLNNMSIYKDTHIRFDKNYIIGHTHQQYVKYWQDWVIVNPGSVGQNRSYINITDFMLFDTDTQKYIFRSLPYKYNQFLSELKSKKYPQECIEYYDKKLKI
jgi:predicted phosphodiesterase